MNKQQTKKKTYDLLRSKFDNTTELVKICDDFRRYKDSINGICEAIIDIDKSDKMLTHLSDSLGYYCDYEYPVIKPTIGSINRFGRN